MKMKIILGSLLFTVVTAISIINGPVALAEGSAGRTYFENINPNIPANGGFYYPGNPNGLIPRQYSGSTTNWGYVMPSWNGSYWGNAVPNDWGDGNGAIGWRELGITNGEATGASAVHNKTRKQALYDLLRSANAGRTQANTGASISSQARNWEQAGSAFVVHQMSGKTWDQPLRGSRTVTTDEWADFRNRLVENDNITMTMTTYSARYNTAGVFANGNFDAVRYEYDYTDYKWAWVFRDVSTNAIVYAIEIGCANPLGALGGLPIYTPETEEFSLDPSGSVNKEVVEPDDSVEVTNTVRNTGSDDSEPTIWRLTEMIYEPGAPLGDDERSARDSANDPCGSFISGGRTECETVQESTDEIFGAGSSKTYNPVYNYVVPSDMPVGTRVCFTVSVSRPTQEASPVWRHDTLRCIMVGKKPKMQVWGGDVRVGGDISTSTNRFSSSGTTYGSWAEYAALSNGANSGLATGSGLNGGNPSDEQCSWSALTLANTLDGENCRFGRYNFTLSSHTLASQFTVTSSTVLSGSRDLNSLPSGVYGTNATEDPLTLTGTTIGSGKSVIIKSTKTVIITGDIVYHNGPYSNARDIPQVVIQAPEIRIMGNVHRVDAWLLALDGAGNGILNTCGDVAIDASLTADMCNEQLTVNGPVVADKIYLRRTAGSNPDGARDAPGEIFNLRADAYLWGNRYGIGSGGARTVHIKELPPRF